LGVFGGEDAPLHGDVQVLEDAQLPEDAPLREVVLIPVNAQGLDNPMDHHIWLHFDEQPLR
jgi:hypothetical protein